jgi:hypothetical protein
MSGDEAVLDMYTDLLMSVVRLFMPRLPLPCNAAIVVDLGLQGRACSSETGRLRADDLEQARPPNRLSEGVLLRDGGSR